MLQQRWQGTQTEVLRAYGLPKYPIDGYELKRGRPAGGRSPFSFGGTGHAPLSTGIADQSSTVVRDQAAPLSMRENDGHLNLAAPAQDLQRYIVAVTADPEVDA
jgi:hypothetical protein